MNGPEKPNDFWDKELEGLDISGFRTTDSLLNFAIDESSGSLEQIRVYQDVRNILQPYEEYLHQLANDCINTQLPDAVKKSRFGNSFSFQIKEGEGNTVGVKISLRKGKSRWLAKEFKVKGKYIIKDREQVTERRIIFNKSGHITRLQMKIGDLYPAIGTINTEKPKSMGFFIGETYKHPVEKDGTFSYANGSFSEFVADKAEDWIVKKDTKAD